ncbi:MAG: exodeoxyribonuclease VII large subunit [Syntrophothermus sp.]
MPWEINKKTIYSLLEVTKSIRKTISERYQKIYWVKAEMNRLNYHPQSGHCFPALVEKAGGKVIAEMKGIIWRDDYVRINTMFLKVLKEPVKDGITILFAARISFDPVHGMSLGIIDIDPSYSLGELEREKNETILRLREEHLFEKNKQLTLPVLPKRLAVISVQTSKGYADFLNVIDKNPYGYKFFHMLFPAVLQGEKAVETILSQLNKVIKVKHHFDAVAIIRGGGGDIGLNCYNQYELAAGIAAFPLPVLTGIGHSTNETVAEMVAHKNAITPTELADFLIQQFHEFAVPVQQSRIRIPELAERLLERENNSLVQNGRFLKSVTASHLVSNRGNIDNQRGKLISETIFFIKSSHEKRKSSITEINKKLPLIIQYHLNQVEHMEQKTSLLDPVNVLKRGFSITYFDGKSLKSAEDVKKGDEVITRLASGIIKSTITDNEHE